MVLNYAKYRLLIFYWYDFIVEMYKRGMKEEISDQ